MMFPDHPAPGVSKNYVHIDTNKFIEAMKQEGFVVDTIKVDNPRLRHPAYVRHMVRFSHADSTLTRPDLRPQVLFMNSHNRTTRATVAMGLIRFACFNGMVTGDLNYRETTRHTGEAARQLIARAAAMARNTAPLFAQIEQWEKIELDRQKQLALAQHAAELRWGGRAGQYTPESLLETRRFEDEGDSLWKVFNRIQENITKGGVVGLTANGRRVQTREITGITADTVVNAQLWRAAAELAA